MKLNKDLTKIHFGGKINSDWFSLIYAKKRKIVYDFNFYLNQFNCDDYLIYKKSGKQKIVSIKEFMNFKYSGYMLYKKAKYKKENIDIWIDFFNNFGGIQYLSKPLPPFDPDKIIIKK